LAMGIFKRSIGWFSPLSLQEPALVVAFWAWVAPHGPSGGMGAPNRSPLSRHRHRRFTRLGPSLCTGGSSTLRGIADCAPSKALEPAMHTDAPSRVKVSGQGTISFCCIANSRRYCPIMTGNACRTIDGPDGCSPGRDAKRALPEQGGPRRRGIRSSRTPRSASSTISAATLSCSGRMPGPRCFASGRGAFPVHRIRQRSVAGIASLLRIRA
jgi:hypothetical protein